MHDKKLTCICSQCGYDHSAAHTKTRQTAVSFTGCLAHIEVTFYGQSSTVLRIRGFLEHNDACCEAGLTREPTRPLHHSVLETAVTQHKDGCSLDAIQSLNRQLYSSRGYPNMPDDLTESPFRWLIEETDHRSIYRQRNRSLGVDTTYPDYINVDSWLDSSSPNYNSTLASAVFHYSARASRDERFEICVANKEMREAAWKYGHHSQVMLDGTFGICDKKMLLFILMGVDENRKGVPLAFLLFSAPGGNRKTCAGYNTEIIHKLLRKWKLSLGVRNGEAFEPYVAITDTDLMERGALILLWPKIWLLICKFHLRQSWKNHRNKVVKGKSQEHTDMRSRLHRLEDTLVATVTISEAHKLIGVQTQDLMRMGGAVAAKGLEHIRYLDSYWTTDALWHSWSDYGRQVAAGLLKCPFEGVLPTTNHLESFNGVLKRKHLAQWKHGGHRVRLDMFIMLLITQILPSIFEQRRLREEERLRFEAQLQKLRGGDKLLEARRAKAVSPNVFSPMAYFLPDERRDIDAQRLIKQNHITLPSAQWSANPGYNFTCWSSLATPHDSQPVSYRVFIALDGRSWCECKDFQHYGGACKHMRAALIVLGNTLRNERNAPPIVVPSSIDEARAIQQRHLSHLLLPSESRSSQIVSNPSPIQHAALAVNNALEGSSAYLEDIIEEGGAVVEDDSDGDGSEEEDVEFEFSALREQSSVAKDALNEQRKARVFYDLKQTTPKLRQLGVLLQGASITETDAPGVSEFLRDIEILYEQLKQMLVDVRPVKVEDAERRAPRKVESIERPTTPLENNKRALGTIIGPSPEKSSKRKTSHAVH